MKTIEPIYDLTKDNVWIYADRYTGECVVDVKERAQWYRRLGDSRPIGTESPTGTKFEPNLVLHMMNQAWALTLGSSVNPRLLHNELMKVKQYQTKVCASDMAHELSASREAVEPSPLDGFPDLDDQGVDELGMTFGHDLCNEETYKRQQFQKSEQPTGNDDDSTKD